MIPKKALEIIGKTLHDICGNNKPFGNKFILLGGDFRQVLPVIENSFKDIIITATIKYSELWKIFKIHYLRRNIRANNPKFLKLLLEIGKGNIEDFVIPEAWRTDDVGTKIYSDINMNFAYDKVILACHNEDVNRLDTAVLNLIKLPLHTYYSTDFATHKGIDQMEDELYLNYPPKYLHSINEGLPLHKLELKKGGIVKLIRDISVSDGLCNGVRLVVIELFQFNIRAKIIPGDNSGKIVHIPRITLNTGGTSSFPFILCRKQFPIKLAFDISINKSQGQSFKEIKLYVNKPLFSHGQLYVALSGCKNVENIYIENHSESENYIRNVVWNETFQ